MRKEDCFLLGKISRKYSFKGEIIARFDVDQIEAYKELESVFLEIRGELVPFFIEKIALLPKGVRIKLEDINDELEADRIIGANIYLHESMLPEKSESELFLHEIIGFDVKDTKSGFLGKLSSVIEGVQDVLEVEHPSGKFIYIPWVDEVIVMGIDREKKTIETECPEGLVELYLV
ncbi:MAG: 16S rRNA processing protein RimM [Cryomorphaceae bacterium]|nr:16S rRNA processing protein RimM [Cryomorphaceae bacterium]